MPLKTISPSVRQRVLHEAGYRCSNPSCRQIITLELHHITWLSKSGANEASNLLALCLNCHGLHHLGKIPEDSIRTWKFLQMSLNEGFDRRAVDVLLALDKLD